MDEWYWFGYDNNRSRNGYENGEYYSKWKFKVTKGTYFLLCNYSLNHDGLYNYKLKYKPEFSKTKIYKCTPKKKAVKVKWKKASKASGYKIQYSLYSSMIYSKTVTIKKSSTTTVTIKKLKSKRYYYIRIRSYKKVKETTYNTYYSSWSSKKIVKTK